MLLAVAGANQTEIDERTRLITTGSWEAFPYRDQLAFRYAYRMTTMPERLQDGDLASLVAAFGRKQACALTVYIAWCNYMTRVADALQLPLEISNIFAKN